MKRGYGPFDYPDRNSERVFVLNEFLRLLQDREPAILDDLYATAFPAFLKALKTRKNHEVYCCALVEGYEPDEGERELIICLQQWAKRHPRLNYPWFLELAYATLIDWCVQELEKLPEKSRKLRFFKEAWGGQLPRGFLAIPFPFSATYPRYQPASMDEQFYKAFLRQVIKEEFHGFPGPSRDAFIKSVLKSQQLREYLKAVNKAFENSGYPNPRNVRNFETHLEWAFLRQIKGLSPEKIAEKNQSRIKKHTRAETDNPLEISAQSVRKATDDLLSLMGFLKRKSDIQTPPVTTEKKPDASLVRQPASRRHRATTFVVTKPIIITNPKQHIKGIGKLVGQRGQIIMPLTNGKPTVIRNPQWSNVDDLVVQGYLTPQKTKQ